MSKIIKIVRTLRNHWKKSIFFSAVAVWGANFGYGRYVEFNLMKAYCKEALKYGEAKLGPAEQARHITVLLNPVANKRKGKSDYEKYCAPLFHLAGIRVSVVTVEAEGQVKDLMEIMNNTDCVVLAGGDGTVHEAITGLLRRQDSFDAIRKYPIGILPIGRNNFISYELNSNIFNPSVDRRVKILAESSMAIIRETLTAMNVMEIRGDERHSRPVYSIGRINIGQIQHVLQRVDEYWYLGQRLKPYLALFCQSFRNLNEKWNQNEPILIHYTKPCQGCSKCLNNYQTLIKSVEDNDQNKLRNTSANKRWWSSFMPLSKQSTEINPIYEQNKRRLESMRNTTNDECDRVETINLPVKNIIIENTKKNLMEMFVHSNELDRWSFISEGVRMYQNRPLEQAQRVQMKSCRIHLKPIDDNGPSIQNESRIKEVNDDDNTEESDVPQQWMSIDNEYYEMPIEKIDLKILPENINIYHSK